jgi:predicted lactoylglutathione lyase
MKTQIFVNLHVKDLKASMDFYTQVGFTNNPQFTDETAACMVLSEEIYVMLITHNRFKDFTKKAISDATKTTEVINAVSMESREKVTEIADKAIAAGATENMPAQDHGFMFLRSFADLDGHIWEVFWMDPTKVQ